MPVSYTFRGRLYRIDCVGISRIQEVKDALLEGLASPDCPRSPVLLIDVSQSTSLPTRTPAEIRDMAGFLAQHADSIGGRCAVVASTDVHFGLIRMGSAHSQDSGLETHVFRSVPEALKWLGAASAPDETDPPRTG